MTNLTKKAIAESLMELLEIKPLDKITIRDITDRCGVTRNTFYYHFTDVYDLLRWIFEEEAREIIGEPSSHGNAEDEFLNGLNYMYSRKKIIYHIYRSISRDTLINYIKGMTVQYAKEIISNYIKDRNVSEDVLKTVADFYTHTFQGAIFEWLDNGMNESPQKLAVLWGRLFIGTMDSAVESARSVTEGQVLCHIENSQSR